MREGGCGERERGGGEREMGIERWNEREKKEQEVERERERDLACFSPLHLVLRIVNSKKELRGMD